MRILVIRFFAQSDSETKLVLAPLLHQPGLMGSLPENGASCNDRLCPLLGRNDLNNQRPLYYIVIGVNGRQVLGRAETTFAHGRLEVATNAHHDTRMKYKIL